jgi:hypothetical protein
VRNSLYLGCFKISGAEHTIAKTRGDCSRAKPAGYGVPKFSFPSRRLFSLSGGCVDKYNIPVIILPVFVIVRVV